MTFLFTSQAPTESQEQPLKGAEHIVLEVVCWMELLVAQPLDTSPPSLPPSLSPSFLLLALPPSLLPAIRVGMALNMQIPWERYR